VAANQPGENKNRMKWDNFPETFSAHLHKFMRGQMPSKNLTDGKSAGPGKSFEPDANTFLQTEGNPCNKEFNKLAVELFQFQVHHNPAYRELCKARCVDGTTIENWHEVPPVPAASFKDFELSCIPPSERNTVFFSSGTTEQRPSKHFHSHSSLALYRNSLVPWFNRHFPPSLLESSCQSSSQTTCKQDERGLALTPNARQAPNSSLVYMFETLRKYRNFISFNFTGLPTPNGAWSLDYDATVADLQEAVIAKQPVLLLGSAFSYVHLLDHLSEKKRILQLPTGSRVLETGGYKGRSRAMTKSELHSQIIFRLGVPDSHIVCEYGMSELGSQAYDRVAPVTLPQKSQTARPQPNPSPQDRCFQFPPWAKVQIISPETGREVAEGERGLIRVFDLVNVYSVMAIQTEDVAIRKGSGFELLGRASLAEQRGCSLMSA
jgi:hypothetical protein